MSNLTRVYKKGKLYIFQDESDLTRINTLGIEKTDYSVAKSRHYFKFDDKIKYSFAFENILDEAGSPYASEEDLMNILAQSASVKTLYRHIATADTNGNLIRPAQARIFQAIISNDKASAVYFKIYNKATAPVVGTDVPMLTLLIPTKTTRTFDFGEEGLLVSEGLGFGITGAFADNDTTALAAGDAIAQLFIDSGSFLDATYEGSIQGLATLTGVLSANGALAGASNGVASPAGVLIDQP